MAKLKELLLDIETSPCIGFFWRPGYGINISHDNIIQEGGIICAAWKWRGEKSIFTADRGKKQNDKAVIVELLRAMHEADHIIYQNGDRFDMKWIRTQAIKHGLQMKPKFKTIDTLKLAKKYFLFNSNKLDYLAKFLVGHGKLKTDYDLWKKIVLNKDQKALDYMLKYNKIDVVRLEEVYDKIAPYADCSTHQGVANGDPHWSCSHCGSYKVIRNKRIVTARGTIQHTMKCTDCGKYHTISDRHYLDYLKYRK